MATGSYERKSFTGGAAPTTVAAPVSISDTSITVANGTGSSYPSGSDGPFVIVINRNTSSEEKVLIASRIDDVLTVDTRGYDDGTAVTHAIGETVEHILDASTVDQANRYVNLQTVKGDLVAHDGTNANAVNVGTDGDVLAADSTADNGVAWTNRLTTAESEIDTLQSDVTTAQSNISTLQSDMTTAQSDITTAQSDITALQGTDIVITLAGDLTGTATITNLGNVTLTAAVVDDSHNHDGRYFTETEADARFLGITAKAADSDKLDALDSTQFLRSDADDTTTGTLTVGGTSKYLKIRDTVDNSHTITFATENLNSNRTVTFPNETGTVSLENHTHDYSLTSHTHSYLPLSGGTMTGDLTTNSNIIFSGNSYIQFEGSTADQYETKLYATNPTADRTIYLPNGGGTLALVGGALDGDDITSGTVADARIASTITRDSEVSSSGWALYGRSTSTTDRATNAYYTIWVTGSTPTATTLRTGDIWIDT